MSDTETLDGGARKGGKVASLTAPSGALAAARWLASVWPRRATVSPETGLPVCIETTRHIVAAFHEAGEPKVTPMACALSAYNAPATAYVIGAGAIEPEGAVKVEVSPEAAYRAGNGKGWWGHLVVNHPEFILDLTLPGVFTSTGAAGFEELGPFCGEKGNDIIEVDGSWMAMTDGGLTLRYEPRRMSGWQNTWAWRGEPDREVITRIAQDIRERL